MSTALCTPGDYTSVNMLAFCTEYSVHRPGAGVAYRLGPLQGKAAGAIGDLLWRGTLQYKLQPQQLQTVSWAIQSGLRYDQMPKAYQSVIDTVIPDHKNELNGDFFQSMEDSYNTNLAKGTKLPPLQQMLAGTGKSGQLALSADRQRQALLAQNTTDQIKDQTLFAGQDSGVYTPVKAEVGPWTEKIPGVAYLRYQIVGGNLAANNIMQIRILPQAGTAQAASAPTPRSIYEGASVRPVSYVTAVARPAPQAAAPPATSPAGLVSGSIGCAVGQGAQCLIPVPATTECNAPCAGNVQQAQAQTPMATLAITFDGNVVTSPQTVLTGQAVNLGYTVSGGSASGCTWQAVGGIGGFTATTQSSTVKMLAAADFKQPSMKIYWIGPGTETVTLDCNLSPGGQGNVTATFNVQGPTNVKATPVTSGTITTTDTGMKVNVTGKVTCFDEGTAGKQLGLGRWQNKRGNRLYSKRDNAQRLKRRLWMGAAHQLRQLPIFRAQSNARKPELSRP